MKLNEKQHNLHERPIAFSVWKDYDGTKGKNLSRFHVCEQDLILEHDFQSKNKVKENIKVDVDVGIPKSNKVVSGV